MGILAYLFPLQPILVQTCKHINCKHIVSKNLCSGLMIYWMKICFHMFTFQIGISCEQACDNLHGDEKYDGWFLATLNLTKAWLLCKVSDWVHW